MLRRKQLKQIVAATTVLLSFLPVYSAGKASDAVKQKILVEKVDGLREDFMKGLDISMIDQIEKTGGKFYNARGEEEDIFQIIKDNGVNYVRIRL